MDDEAVLIERACAGDAHAFEALVSPHLDAAKTHGIEPKVVQMPRIALDIDTPEDLALFVRTPSQTRAYALLRQWRLRLDDEGLPATSA